ncbi:charged multivesicular body protein 7 isoform X1 [Hydra vulgaris]|uniref:charged multivesicular body protein 7 isoform X1 n=1 Tax=Hydra vulgaris TaxID=6087 RepID=UPI001F5F34D3|nr:charged multivesicular body protein 7 [Hydra vulgaris]
MAYESEEEKFNNNVKVFEDDERIKFMFSSFPSDKSVNPAHWESKIRFWTSEIINSCRVIGDICFNYEQLKSRFKDSDKRSPAGLKVVLDDLYNKQQLIKCYDVNDLFDVSWTKWSYKLAKSSASWMWNRLWNYQYDEQTVFVVKDLLEEAANAILEAHYKRVKYEKTDNVVPWTVIKSLYKVNEKSLPDNNLVCIVAHLKNNGKCRVGITDTGEKIVKFKDRNQNFVEPVSKNDFDIIRLKKTIAKLCIENEKSEKELQSLQNQAQGFMKLKDKVQVRKTLIQKQKLQKILTMKDNALSTMKNQLCMIQEAENTKMIAEAFHSTAILLNESYRQSGLTIDHIDDVMAKTEEARDMVNEVEEALSFGVNRIDDFDIEELEQELSKLTATKDEETVVLPNVPDFLPTKSKEHLNKQKIDLITS